MAVFTVEGQIVLVTGGSRGLGAGIAIELAHAGADVAITARDLDSLVQDQGTFFELGLGWTSGSSQSHPK